MNKFGLISKISLLLIMSALLFAQFERADDDLRGYQQERAEKMAVERNGHLEVVSFHNLPPLPVAHSEGVQEGTGAVEDTDTSEDKGGGLIGFLKDYWALLLPALLALIEVIVRVTPTKKDDSVFNFIKYLLDKIIPNTRTGGGTH